MKTGSLTRLGRALCLTVAFGLASIAFAQKVFVDINAPPGGDGSNQAPFNSIETAVAYANGLSETPTIEVAAGRYPVSATLVIQKGMILRGSNRMLTDSDGFPTGADPQTESRIVGTAALGANRLVSIGANNGQTISPIDIRQLTFEAGPGMGDIMHLTGVQDFTIRSSVFVGSTTLPQPTRGIGVLTNASSGELGGNFVRGLTAGVIVRGGSAASPANVTFHDNRSVGHGNGGVFLSGTSDGTLYSGNQLNATVRNNDLSGSAFSAQGFGLRITVKSQDDPIHDIDNGHVTADVRDNRIVGNFTGIALDAGFTFRLIPPDDNVCDPRSFTGTLDLTFRDNAVSGSTGFPTVISFTRLQTTLGIPTAPLSRCQYLHGATYSIDDRGGVFAGAKFDHPATDPFIGPCAADLTNEPLNNVLTINGIPQSTTSH
ncbi:hypothetical protein GCM10027034_37060 [Ramlibacter solisilvae]|uniref:DUF1565 domain-containing protein n=1 Tax=Ramlibacter tataouinensis TaxID=94132 RepID=A0A127JUL6_9BURK|nr:hypothetical protein [Ramlibacter tataouinensis]AMO23696.1 hypothetical protein UC35_13460 [Ramlibacter tataouinensis]